MRWTSGMAVLAGVVCVMGCTQSTSGTPSQAQPEAQRVEITVAPGLLSGDGQAQATVTVTTLAGREASVRLTTDRGSFLESGGRELTKPTTGTVTTTLVACLAARPECPGEGTLEATVDGLSATARFTVTVPGSGSSSGGQSGSLGASGSSAGSSGTPGSGVQQLLVTPPLAGAGTVVTVSFKAPGMLMGEPQVTVAGNAAAQTARVGPVFVYTYTVAGTETQGAAPVVVTVTYADGTTSRAEGAVTLDFATPVPVSTVVMPDGRGAFVSGFFTATAAIQPGGAAPVACQMCVSTDGACDTEWTGAQVSGPGCYNVGQCMDGRVVTVNFRGQAVANGPWTYANAVTRICDDANPNAGAVRIVSGPSTGMFVANGFRIGADLDDGAGSGPAGCDVCMTRDLMCDTEWVPGTLTPQGTCEGPATTCMDGVIRLAVRVTDAVNRQGVGPLLMARCDNATPSPANVEAGPAPGSTEVPNNFTLTAAFYDVGAGVSDCETCVSRDGLCDTEWTAATDQGGFCQTENIPCTDGENLTLNVRARDALLGTLVTATPVGTVCDATPPAMPTNFRATTLERGTINLAWDAVADERLAAQPYLVHYARNVAPPYDGMGAMEGPSPVARSTTTAQLSMLAECARYELGVTAVDSVGQQSPMATLRVRTRCGGDGTFVPSQGVLTDNDEVYLPRVADFTGDGVDDVMVAGYSTPTLRVLIGGHTNGQPNGQFTRSPLIPVSGDPTSLEVGDFNGDGIKDAAVAYRDSYFGIVLGQGANGRGNGAFRTETIVDSVSGSTLDQVLVADLNRDGLDDVLAVVYGYRLISYINTGVNMAGAPSFSPVVNLFSTYNPFGRRAIAVHDVTGDGILDLVFVTSSSTPVLSVWFGGGAAGRGNGTFGSFTTLDLPNGDSAVELVVAQVDGDGIEDILLGFFNSHFSVRLLRGESVAGVPNGRFTVGPASLDADMAYDLDQMLVADFNNDSVVDVVLSGEKRLTGGSYREASVVMLGNRGPDGYGDGTFTFSDQHYDSFYNNEVNAVVLDANGDSLKDFMVVDGRYSVANQINLYLGNGVYPTRTGTFTAAPPLPLVSAAADVALARLDGTSALSVLTLHPPTSAVEVRLGVTADGQATGTLRSPATYATGVSPHTMALGDLNRDGHPDVVTLNDDASDVSVLFSRGWTGTLAPAVSLASGGRARALALGDLNADGRDDVVLADGMSNSVMVMLSVGSTLAPPVSVTVSSTPVSVAVGDVDGDRIPDVVAALAVGGAVLLRGQGQNGLGTGTLGPPSVVGGNAPADEVLLVDVTDDRILDLVVARTVSGAVEVLVGQGTGGRGNGMFAAPVVAMTGVSVARMRLVDVNQDGRLDLLVADLLEGDVMLALGRGMDRHGDGTFNAPTPLMAGAGSSLAVADLDADSLLDAVVLGDSGMSLRILNGG